MITFHYKGFDADGNEVSGTLEAHSENLAFETLASRGLTVYKLLDHEVSENDLPWYRRDLDIFGSGLRAETEASIADLFSALFSARLSELEVIRIATLAVRDPTIKKQLARTGKRLSDGSRLGDAFEIENPQFSQLFKSFVNIAADANKAEQAFGELARFLRQQNEVRQKIVSALIYPTILVLAGIALLLLVTLYLAPNLAPLFSLNDQPVPRTLSALLTISDVFTQYAFLIFLLVLAAIAAVVYVVGNPNLRSALIVRAHHIPILGPVLANNSLLKLTRTTEMLLRSGAGLSEALMRAAQEFEGQTPLAVHFMAAAHAIKEGARASTAFEAVEELDPAFRELFKIGEETNRLQAILESYAQNLRQQLDQRVQRLLGLLTPCITLILGLVIGFLIYVLMGAILEVNEIAF